MAFKKQALLSPAINAQQQMPSEEDQRQLFEEKFGQMAYQAFSSKFPDLVPEIVTFKLLDSDIEAGTGIGAFILEQEGDYVYIPAILSENELKPFDIMYVKAKDIFLPLTPQWLEEVKKGTISSLGEGSKLPETVATDVDIRNLVVPPTTGRYSYASANMSPHIRLAASATEPLGRKLTKLAIGPFPMGGPGQQSEFNPEIWATFVDQFQRTQNMTPGQALDNNVLDVETLGKMYKSHTKTWEMMQDPNAATATAAMQNQQGQQMAPQGAQQMAPQGMPAQDPAQGSMVTAAFKGAAASPLTMGQKLDVLLLNAGKGGLAGAASGALTADYDDWRELPGIAAKGAVGGALMAPLGRVVGEHVSGHMTGQPSTAGREIGRAVGGAVGGIVGTYDKPRNNYESQSPGMISSALSAIANPFGYATRYASDYTAGLKSMLKHAQKRPEYKPKLLQFLSNAPAAVKTAYIKVLDKNPRLLQKTANLYGGDALLNALTVKTASVSSTGGALYIADRDTKANDYTSFFGDAAPEAFNGVLMRGYYFKDTRPSLKLAVQVQERHTFQDTLNSGVYRLYTTKGTPVPALVLTEPFDLLNEDRYTFPADDNRVKRLRNKVPARSFNHEPNDLTPFNGRAPVELDIDRSHIYSRVAILDNGDYLCTTRLFGEECSEAYLKGSRIYDAVLRDGTSKPSKGKGVFVQKRGAQYHGTRPVEISELSVGSDGIVRGKLTSPGSMLSKSFVMDPRSPINRPMKMREQNMVIIPASWKWISLGSEQQAEDYMRTPKAFSDIVLNSMGSMGVHEAVARDAGQSMYTVDGSRATSKKEALFKLATDHNIHASAAEAMLKLASIKGSCRAFIVNPDQYQQLQYRIKTAQGMAMPQTPMGGPPAMQAPAGMPPAMPPATPPAMPPAMQGAAPMPPPGAPAPAAPSAVDQAFAESMDSLQTQMTALQAQLDVLTTVQQRAQEIETGQPAGGDPAMEGAPGGAPAMQDMQGMPPGMDPATGADPAAAAEPPPMPMMRTETPSASEIASQVNPAFLENASHLHETGAFDAGTIASLAKNPNMKDTTSEYAANLESAVDDLGRSLLTLYMQEPKLKVELGDEAFMNLETQLRDTFQGLGKLVLTMTHNSTMLNSDAYA